MRRCWRHSTGCAKPCNRVCRQSLFQVEGAVTLGSHRCRSSDRRDGVLFHQPSAFQPSPRRRHSCCIGATRMSVTRRQRERWHDRRVAKRWRYRLAPDPRSRPPKGLPGLWMRLRRMLWSWWPWAALFLVAMVLDRWYWAAGLGLMAVFCYMIAPKESPPRYGLDHAFSVTDEEFLPTMAGATGAVVRRRQPHRDPEQRRRVLSGHARGHRARRGLDQHRGLHLLGTATSASGSRRHWRIGPARASP